MARFHSGGVHPDDHKSATHHKPIEILPPPPQVIIPMRMHIGAPCEPLVRPGQEVTLGMRIADSKAPVSSPIHASVSGRVAAIEQRPHPSGSSVQSIVLDNDGKDTLCDTIHPQGSVESLSKERLAEIIRDAGIVGLGGAAFPTHIKIASAMGKCDTVIINGAECEPYITSDHRIMLEAPEEVVGGLRILIKLLEPEHAIIAIEQNKRDAAESLRATLPSKSSIRVEMLPTKYPQGAEKQLVRSITGREIPPGKLPADVGCAVFNVDSAAAIHRAVTTGMPLIRRIVTVSGSAVSNAKSLNCRIGTPFKDIFDATGGFRETPAKVLMGGPMMGIAQADLSASLVKGCGSLLALAYKDVPPSGDQVCIRCGKCVAVCPMRLAPIYLYMYERQNKLAELEKLHISDCHECGSCSYICPGRLYLVHAIRTGKQKIVDARAAAKGSGQ